MNVKNMHLIALFVVLLCSLRTSPVLSTHKTPADSTMRSELPKNWHNLDFETDGVYGVSTEKAYQTILKGKPSKTVVVAIIDSGIDTEHEDLKDKIWINEDELAGNGIDDDKNGYVDDLVGWNFIGGKDGKHVNYDTYELTREYNRLHKKFDGREEKDIGKKEKEEFAYYKQIKKDFAQKVKEQKLQAANIKEMMKEYENSSQLMALYLHKEKVTLDDLKQIKSPDLRIQDAVQMLSYALEQNFTQDRFKEMEKYYTSGLHYGYNPNFNPRTIVGDDENNMDERIYGNAKVKGPDASHGTHVAGIVGADRNNDLGIKGIADNVKIMPIRAVPNGDERDKDIANAIYYAVDNGAQVINMSFGKGYSPNKETVDKAVKYAQKKGVLLVHAAGNDGENIDEVDNFPSAFFKRKRKKRARNWIEVGATSPNTEQGLVAIFSNYGKKSVDVFAPGVNIYATIPGNQYEEMSGTSMAAPVVSGVAALVMSYYPTLSATEVKDILLKSAIPYEKKVMSPGLGGKIDFHKLSKTGAIINAYQAVKMAEEKTKKHKK